ncbi:OLC1v1012503C1 [Oldenlandia corymbosa var. corymbosa]|uniref:OLC1v1012503C1 n=1 Tax=Oldenlandia corymbosa var. corymbosa TaxID=529605 RepID=A0AAV1DZ36_OLDCO|nr:OLC1v1012503C1 [Oldenlandia corymbosa var. corymbosa]
MGRAKLEMQLIAKEKQRVTTFKKRKDGLIRKIHELTTLCDVNGCMIIRPPNQDNLSPEIETWPENPDFVSGIIEKYRANPDVGGSRTYTLTDFYQCRSKKVVEELEKKRKKRREMQHHQMRISNFNNNNNMSSTRLLLPGASIQRNLEPWDVSNRIHVPALLQETPHQQHQIHHPELNNSSSMVKLLMGGDQDDYIHGGNHNNPSNFAIQFPSFKHEIQHESSPVSSLDSAAGQLFAYSTMPPLPPFHGQNFHQQTMGTFMPIQYPANVSDIHQVHGHNSSENSREKELNDFFHCSFKDHRERR